MFHKGVIYAQRRKKVQCQYVEIRSKEWRFKFRKFESSFCLCSADGYAVHLPETSSL